MEDKEIIESEAAEEIEAPAVDERDLLIEELSNRIAVGFISNVEVLASMASLSERYYDGSHSRYVAEKCVQIGEELGMEEEDIYELKVAALLHDIGKVAFFDSALYKQPNEMTPIEYDQYSQHPTIATHILGQHSDFSHIAEIIGQHHERLDGSGFPKRLSGDSILPAAKIIIVADYFHNAVYKKIRNRSTAASPSSKISSTTAFLEPTTAKFNYALNYLYKKRNILFEKKVVDVFIDIVQVERMSLGQKAVMRIPINKIQAGMVFAEDYHTKFGILIAAKGEKVAKEQIPSLVRFAENDQIPMKILVLK